MPLILILLGGEVRCSLNRYSAQPFPYLLQVTEFIFMPNTCSANCKANPCICRVHAGLWKSVVESRFWSESPWRSTRIGVYWWTRSACSCNIGLHSDLILLFAKGHIQLGGKVTKDNSKWWNQDSCSLDWVAFYNPCDIYWSEAHPYKQVYQHAENNVSSFIEAMRNLSPFKSQNKADKSQQGNITKHEAKSHARTFYTLKSDLHAVIRCHGLHIRRIKN